MYVPSSVGVSCTLDIGYVCDMVCFPNFLQVLICESGLGTILLMHRSV